MRLSTPLVLAMALAAGLLGLFAERHLHRPRTPFPVAGAPASASRPGDPMPALAARLHAWAPDAVIFEVEPLRAVVLRSTKTQRFLMCATACGGLAGLPIILDGLVILSPRLKMDGKFGGDLPRSLAVRKGFAFRDAPMQLKPARLRYPRIHHFVIQRVPKTVAPAERPVRPLFYARLPYPLPGAREPLALGFNLFTVCCQS